MTFFQLYSHCYLVSGSVHDAIFDVFQSRVFWLSESRYRKLVRALEQGGSLEDFCQDTGEELEKIQVFVELLVAMDYGSYQLRPSYPEKFRPVILSGQEETFTLHRPQTRVIVEISSRCSLKCSICGFKNGLATSLCACGAWPSPDETPKVDLPRLVSELAAYGCRQLHIQGGDPFLEPHTLHKLVLLSREMNLEVSVQTPGSNLTKKDFNFIQESGLRLVVPVFGADAETHDAVARVSGAFKGLTELLRRCKSRAVTSLTARVILTNDTILQEEEIKKFLLANGVCEIIVDVYTSLDDSVNEDLAKKDTLLSLFKRSPRDFRVPMETFFRLAKGHKCWQDELAITRSGEVLPCIAARHHVIGELNKKSLIDLFRTKQHLPYRNCGNDSFSPCSGCEFRYGCSSCSLATERILGTIKQRNWDCTYQPILGEWDHPAIALCGLNN